ncbi:hypothetical protein F5Y09DRAFT_194013 [Xylaria sp. FL1042]|nr:hypothetical protein F5Y09DRAFT_194013 [Xylaria sp. FL1042]
MQFVPSPKSTPSRRRPPSSRGRNGSQKVYASENDIPVHKPNSVASPTTPQKSASSRPAAPQAHSSNQKQRNKSNKSRNNNNKNGVASPGHRLDGGDSPSFQSKEAPATIFAGSTFHASPAPSALPLPSFLGPPSADSPASRRKTIQAAQDSTPPQTDSDEASPVDEPVPRVGESPLEFFFRADRAEKARVRRASSANTDALSAAPFLSYQDSSRKECNTFPKTTGHHSLRRLAFTECDSSPGVSSSELDGSSRLPVGPAFSTPYSERIRAARSTPSSAQPTPTLNRNLNPSSSEALKRYLFTGQLEQPGPLDPSLGGSLSQTAHGVIQQHRPTASRQQGAHQSSLRQFSPIPNLPGGASASHAPRAQPTSSVHANTEPNPRSDHILALEGNLRRVLKLDALG